VFRRLFVALGLAVLPALASPATAQSCSDLTITGPGTQGSTLNLSLTGAEAHGLVVLVLGTETGSTNLDLGPVGSLQLGLEWPFVPFPVGITNGNGEYGLSIPVWTFGYSIELHAQAFSVTLDLPRPPLLSFCVSDVEPLSIGG
jgi:hypothetical protein